MKISYPRFTNLISKSLVFERYGNVHNVLKVKPIPIAKLEPTEILVETYLSSINPMDINQVQGTYPLPPPSLSWDGIKFMVGGNESLAKVVAKGSQVDKFQLGDLVVSKWDVGGCWQSLRKEQSTKFFNVQPIVNQHHHVNWEVLSQLLVNLTTAYQLLTEVKRKGQKVCVQNAANSTVGKAIVYLAKRWNLKTVNLIRNNEYSQLTKAKLAQLGATHTFTETESLTPAVQHHLAQLYPNQLHYGLDGVGGRQTSNLFRLLSPNGICIQYGNLSKKPSVIPTSPLLFKNLTFQGFWLVNFLNSTEELETLSLYQKVYQEFINFQLDLEFLDFNWDSNLDLYFEKELLPKFFIGGGRKKVLRFKKW